MGEIIDGNAVAAALKVETRAEVAALVARGVRPAIATVLVGDDHGARMYRRQIERIAGEIGVEHRAVTLPETASSADVTACVRALAADPTVHGILPLRPLPEGTSEDQALEALDTAKDIDGLHPVNAGRLALGRPTLYPATPWACFELIERHFARQGIDPKRGFEGKNLVIVGRSNIVGKPAYFMALQRNATPTTVHSFTSRAGMLTDHTRRAEILIVA
ncbi:MAG: bifunctional 5,10-methylenetetrahydrofolate dehydrogenase/5,10-methenyltetrahydrofolate cyclohydrolase, partial [bacterium]